jgi:5,10-methylenetetrahydromethanopterin reductase
VLFHWALENRRVDVLPNGEAWAAAYADLPPRDRHHAHHDRHLVAVNARDRPFVTGVFLREQQLALTRAEWRERLAMLEAAGATEIAYQPAGPAIAKELEAFVRAAR